MVDKNVHYIDAAMSGSGLLTWDIYSNKPFYLQIYYYYYYFTEDDIDLEDRLQGLDLGKQKTK